MANRSVRRAQIWAENGWVKCQTPFDKQKTPLFAEAVKTRIDCKLRQWSKSEGSWLVDPSCLDEIIEITREFYPDVLLLNGSPDAAAAAATPRPASEPLNDGTYGTMAILLRAASPEALRRVYRDLAVDLHPDHGGDQETMRRLNTAWDRIKMERGIK
jgi:hypothetical protein